MQTSIDENFEMTPEQIEHMEKIISFWGKRVRKKYPKGAKKYRTKLWEMPFPEKVENTLQEMDDIITYIVDWAETSILLYEENKQLKAHIALCRDVNVPELEREFPPKMKQIS